MVVKQPAVKPGLAESQLNRFEVHTGHDNAQGSAAGEEQGTSHSQPDRKHRPSGPLKDRLTARKKAQPKPRPFESTGVPG
jgi:hypothetical protein